MLTICNIFYDIYENINSFEKDGFIEELIVIMKQDWGSWHG